MDKYKCWMITMMWWWEHTKPTVWEASHQPWPQTHTQWIITRLPVFRKSYYPISMVSGTSQGKYCVFFSSLLSLPEWEQLESLSHYNRTATTGWRQQGILMLHNSREHDDGASTMSFTTSTMSFTTVKTYFTHHGIWNVSIMAKCALSVWDSQYVAHCPHTKDVCT